MRAIEKRLKRNPELPKWDILIEPMAAVWWYILCWESPKFSITPKMGT
jgi:hypothetical protein